MLAQPCIADEALKANSYQWTIYISLAWLGPMLLEMIVIGPYNLSIAYRYIWYICTDF